jgi:hypothetical protein
MVDHTWVPLNRSQQNRGLQPLDAQQIIFLPGGFLIRLVVRTGQRVLTPRNFVHKFNSPTLAAHKGDQNVLRKLLTSVALLAVLSIAALAQQPTPPHTHLKVGDKAPDFTLRATDGKQYKLSDFKGQKNVVLAIYVLAFTGG